MSLFSFFWPGSRFDGRDRITFDWDGTAIDFSAWRDSPFGTYLYQTRDRQFDFEFELKPVGRAVRICIRKQPTYRGRPDDGETTHRLGLTDGAPYICIKSDLAPTNVPDALSWAVYWAEMTAEYIKTGRPFS